MHPHSYQPEQFIAFNTLLFMKKAVLTLLLIFSICYFSLANPILTPNKYLIGTLYDEYTGTGTVSPGTSSYPLVFYPERNEESATESDYWIITNQGNSEYTFQNAHTLKYIQYNATATSDRTALILVDTLQTDHSTSFTLELKETNGLSYYVIRSVSNTMKIWGRRITAYETLYPVGVYSGAGASNECFIFYDSDGDPVVDDKKVSIHLPSGGQTLGAFSDYADSLTFDKKIPVIDTSKMEFYLTIPESGMGLSAMMKVGFTPKNSAYKLYICDTEVTSGSDYTFRNVTASEYFNLEIRNGSTVLASGTLKFSCLPLVQIYSDSNIGFVYNLAKLFITEPDKAQKTELLLSKIKIRGATASGMPKKPYAVKLVDRDGVTSIDRSFLGLRSDNNWILDAMYIDLARMRNRVSTDLWNDFSTPPYYATSEPDMINGTRGGFVEVFLNNSYDGLYCMTEKIDRKQLKLKKLIYNSDSTVVTQRGGLYKSVLWSDETMLGINNINTPVLNYNNNSDKWAEFENKYPDFGDGEPIEWKPLYDAVKTSWRGTGDDLFKTKVEAAYDLPVFLDYYLFIELLMNADNTGKNTYLSVYDQTISSKLSITPWDCDGTWGRNWDGSFLDANFDFWQWIINNMLFRRLRELDYKGFLTSNLKNRYEELRGTYFTYSSLTDRFQNYCNLFNKSGAAVRESKRWSIGDINDEMTYVSSWISNRLTYMDNLYLGGPFIGNSVADVAAKRLKFTPTPVIDMLTVSNLTDGDRIQVISIQGTILIQTQSDGYSIVLDMSRYAPGVYLIKVNETISKIIKK